MLWRNGNDAGDQERRTPSRSDGSTSPGATGIGWTCCTAATFREAERAIIGRLEMKE